MFASKTVFKDYAITRIEELQLLLNFQLSKPKDWVIDWNNCIQISQLRNRQKWNSIPIFQELYEHRTHPGVYYFIIEPKDGREIHEAFSFKKTIASKARIQKGLKADEFLSISHVPKILTESSCLYVGSRVNCLHERLVQHLGFSSGKRTGALYLYQVLSGFNTLPKITFYCHILDKKYVNIIKHIECVIQDNLKPFIGKRAL